MRHLGSFHKVALTWFLNKSLNSVKYLTVLLSAVSSVWFEKRTIYPLFFILTRKLSPSWIARLVGKVEIQGGSSCASLLEHPVVSFHKSTEIFLNSKFTGCPNWQGTSVSFNFGRIPVDFGPHTEQWLINASRRNLFFLVVVALWTDNCDFQNWTNQE